MENLQLRQIFESHCFSEPENSRIFQSWLIAQMRALLSAGFEMCCRVRRDCETLNSLKMELEEFILQAKTIKKFWSGSSSWWLLMKKDKQDTYGGAELKIVKDCYRETASVDVWNSIRRIYHFRSKIFCPVCSGWMSIRKIALDSPPPPKWIKKILPGC